MRRQEKARALTWYGHLSGPSSAVPVSQGFIAALRDAGYEVTAVDLRKPPADLGRRVERLKTGHHVRPPEAPGLGIVAGFPEWSQVVPRHETLLAFTWAELDRLPLHWPKALNALDGVLADSTHTRTLLEAHGIEVPITVTPHGVDAAYRPDALGEPSDGTFRFLHFCSGDLAVGRKGTLELLAAWDRVSGQLEDGRLVIVTSAKAVRRAVAALARSWTVDLLPEGWRPPGDQARLLQTHHMLVAPSRAEGFGKIPLESLCCGVPVLATTCTGHADWAPSVQGGMLEIPTGRVAACSPGPGRAPRLSETGLESALLNGYYRYGRLRTEALETATDLREAWSWPVVLGPLLALLGAKA